MRWHRQDAANKRSKQPIDCERKASIIRQEVRVCVPRKNEGKCCRYSCGVPCCLLVHGVTCACSISYHDHKRSVVRSLSSHICLLMHTACTLCHDFGTVIESYSVSLDSGRLPAWNGNNMALL